MCRPNALMAALVTGVLAFTLAPGAPAGAVRADAQTGTRARADAPPGMPARADASPGTPARADASPGMPARADASPGMPARADASPGTRARADASPGTRARADASPGTRARADAPPGTPARPDAPTGMPARADVPTGTPAPAATPTVANAGFVVARYTFDSLGAIVDSSGRGHTLLLVAGHGGTVRSIVHGSGYALAFPAKCTAKAASACPHAVLQTPGAADLNPGNRPIAYGASVLLAKSQTTDGQNVVQKGYSATSSQYKLQVDGLAGRPSCALVDDKKPTIRLVRSSISVADDRWHMLECRRAGSSFAILIDGVTRGTLIIPAGLSVNNKGPLSIGGKGTSPNNDQFQGALDNVWIRIG